MSLYSFIFKSVSICAILFFSIQGMCQQGNVCTDPYIIDYRNVDSILDTLTVDATEDSDFFEYTVPEDGYLHLSTCKAIQGDVKEILRVYTGGCSGSIEEVTSTVHCVTGIEWQRPVFKGEVILFEYGLDPAAPEEDQIDKIYDVIFYYRRNLNNFKCTDAKTISCEGEFELDIRGIQQWFTWTAPRTGEFNAAVNTDINPEVLFDGVPITVYKGTDCGTKTFIADNDSDDLDFPPNVPFIALAGETFFIKYQTQPIPLVSGGLYTGQLMELDNPPVNGNSFESMEVSVCDDYTFDGQLLSDPGMYHGEFISQTGCDSLVTVKLNILSNQITQNISVCDNYEFDGNTLTTSGLYFGTFMNAVLCDSIVTLNLTINESTQSALTESACDSYDFLGTVLTSSGLYNETLTNSIGCDSLVTLDLTINESTQSALTESACESYNFLGTILNTSGTYNEALTNSVGCDSLVTLNLTINESTGSTITETTCGSYDFLGTILTTSGMYNETLTNILGCDSLVTLNLTVNNSTTAIINEATCDSYNFNGTVLATSGTYTDTVTSAAGCDQVVTLNLIINEATNAQINEAACESYDFLGTVLTSSGIYNETLVNTVGCDSLVTLNLIINESTSSSLTETACNEYDFLGTLLTSTGIYNETLTNAIGCDSLVTLSLTINESTESTINNIACDSYDFLGTVLTTSGMYNEMLTNSVGCDSLVTLNLTIQEVPIANITQNGVVLFANEIDGATYQWVDCDNNNDPLTGETKRQLTPPRTGNFAVEVLHGACASISDCVNFDWVLGTSALREAKMSIYPTITSGEIHLNTNQRLDDVQIVVSSLNGTIVFYKQLSSLTNEKSLFIDVVDGIYLVQVTAHDQLLSTQRIIIRN